MPELPEVEIVKQSLNRKVINKKIKKIVVRNRDFRIKLPKNFEKFFKNKKIQKISRISKYLIIHLSNEKYCIAHLGMSGTFHLINNNYGKKFTNLSFYHSLNLPKKHNHIEIIFDDFRIIYNDPRRFGFFQIIKNSKELKSRFQNIGPEPFDKRFNANYIKNFFKKKDKNIKNYLIDQKFVSGIGNIYASEILFLSKINPKKKVKNLSSKECKQIVIYSKKVLLNAIEKGGSSIRDFRNISGYKGNFQDNFNVYQREGLKCKRYNCNEIIKKKSNK
ncbi:bifunctional DNA-formamidopyrimidine glycosylase/DNA-(apurinic or apyrimidinic site) lyase [Candidatus Pelagibacter sp.]|nr:bifunctional DNA-formamidopyrimidine glycosylase/DNA-(apurinic or apyrimidinic site) lyase [Candidatus Pelagibacter sp.]